MRRYLLVSVALVVLVAHIVWPNRVSVDWPTIALLVILIALVGAPELSKFLPFVKRLKLGQAEIEMQESVQRLHQDVEKAEDSSGKQLFLAITNYARMPTEKEITGSESNILELAAKDKESAVVRLVIEIEKELATLYLKNDLGPEPPKTIREMVNQLAFRKIISPSTAAAIIEFRNVRNQVIHPSQTGMVPQSVLVSAIDSGIRLLRILRASEGS
jgi:hypothetical protein